MKVSLRHLHFYHVLVDAFYPPALLPPFLTLSPPTSSISQFTLIPYVCSNPHSFSPLKPLFPSHGPILGSWCPHPWGSVCRHWTTVCAMMLVECSRRLLDFSSLTDHLSVCWLIIDCCPTMMTDRVAHQSVHSVQPLSGAVMFGTYIMYDGCSVMVS